MACENDSLDCVKVLLESKTEVDVAAEALDVSVCGNDVSIERPIVFFEWQVDPRK